MRQHFVVALDGDTFVKRRELFEALKEAFPDQAVLVTVGPSWPVEELESNDRI